ncbi:MAG: hypothetical protein PHV30_02830 [Candidatus Margulisbacteria bacterium]|nr:hypothetical protein [Candidatus Margulisiibacteriota bacterium]
MFYKLIAFAPCAATKKSDIDLPPNTNKHGTYDHIHLLQNCDTGISCNHFTDKEIDTLKFFLKTNQRINIPGYPDYIETIDKPGYKIPLHTTGMASIIILSKINSQLYMLITQRSRFDKHAWRNGFINTYGAQLQNYRSTGDFRQANIFLATEKIKKILDLKKTDINNLHHIGLLNLQNTAPRVDESMSKAQMHYLCPELFVWNCDINKLNIKYEKIKSEGVYWVPLDELYNNGYINEALDYNQGFWGKHTINFFKTDKSYVLTRFENNHKPSIKYQDTFFQIWGVSGRITEDLLFTLSPYTRKQIAIKRPVMVERLKSSTEPDQTDRPSPTLLVFYDISEALHYSSYIKWNKNVLLNYLEEIENLQKVDKVDIIY